MVDCRSNAPKIASGRHFLAESCPSDANPSIAHPSLRSPSYAMHCSHDTLVTYVTPAGADAWVPWPGCWVGCRAIGRRRGTGFWPLLRSKSRDLCMHPESWPSDAFFRRYACRMGWRVHAYAFPNRVLHGGMRGVAGPSRRKITLPPPNLACLA